MGLLPHLASSGEWMGLTDRLIHLIAQQELLMGVVDSAPFREFPSALNPRYAAPSLKVLQDMILERRCGLELDWVSK